MKIENYRGDVNFKYIICPSRLSSALFVSEIGKRRWKQAKEAFPAYRDYYTLHFLRTGNGKFCGAPFMSGQGFVSFPNEKCWYERGDDWHIYWVKFGGSEAARFLDCMGLTTARVVDFKHCSALHEALDEFLENPERAENATEIDFLGLLFTVLAAVRLPERAWEKPSDYVNRAKAYIEENFDMDISVSSIAASLHISEKHLWRVFKAETGSSPKHYIVENRLRRAEELKQSFPDIRISEIAASVGYGSPEAFLQVYKRHRGRTFGDAAQP